MAKAKSDLVRVRYEIKGAAPMLMHNGQLANPMNEWVKALKRITAKGRKMTDEDHAEKLRCEFFGSFYFSEELGPYIPGDMLDAVLVAGAKKSRKGQDFKCSVFTDAEAFALTYKGPRTREELWAEDKFRDIRPACVGTSTVMRCRPIFRDWSLKFDVSYMPEIVNATDLDEALEKAGLLCGIGDYRPRFGRFVVTDKKSLS